jgi:glycosyltransferase involved in cell wall biosynthesis
VVPTPRIVSGAGSGIQRLGARKAAPVTPGVRVVLDARPLQAPDRAPLAAAYLEGLLGAYDADPLPGESFAFFLRSDLAHPTKGFRNPAVFGRGLFPPTRILGAAGMTVDPFILRGASLGVAWRAERSGAAGAVYHVIGGGPLPIAPGLPVVATLLDLAPWELPDAFQQSLAGRFGHRLRAQLIRDADVVVVGTEAVGQATRRLLHVRRERLRVVRLVPRAAFVARATRRAEHETAELRSRLGVGERYLVFSGRFDARLDHGTLLGSLGILAGRPRPRALDTGATWPPQVVLAGASPDDRASIARAAARAGIGASLVYAPTLSTEALAGLVRAARAAILPVFSEAAGLPFIEALAVGTPVVASAVGALPELVGRAGLLVEPRDADRLAIALSTIWADDTVHARVAVAARERPKGHRRNWADLAAETRTIYAEVGVRAASPR